MGYPMTWTRLLSRNALTGDYQYPIDGSIQSVKGMIAGDMRRLENDSRDEAHLKAAAAVAGITVDQARKVLDLFFSGQARLPAHPVDANGSPV